MKAEKKKAKQDQEEYTGKNKRRTTVRAAAALMAVVMAAVVLWVILTSPPPSPREQAPLDLPSESGTKITAVPTYDGERSESRAEQLRQNARRMTVRIKTPFSFGSGIIFAVTGDWLYVGTAAHVLPAYDETYAHIEDMAAQEVSVVFCDGREISCGAIHRAEDADLAFIQIPLSEFSDDFAEQYGYAATDKDTYDALASWDTVLCMGILETDEAAVYEGYLMENWIYVEDFAQYMILAKCRIYPGMSGGGLYDEQGFLIGIACGGNEQGELAAVPLPIVQAQFQMVTQAGKE